MCDCWRSKYEPAVREPVADVAGRVGTFAGEGIRCVEDVVAGWCDALRPRRRLEVCCCCGAGLAGPESPHRSPRPLPPALRPPAAGPPGGVPPPYPWKGA